MSSQATPSRFKSSHPTGAVVHIILIERFDLEADAAERVANPRRGHARAVGAVVGGARTYSVAAPVRRAVRIACIDLQHTRGADSVHRPSVRSGHRMAWEGVRCVSRGHENSHVKASHVKSRHLPLQLPVAGGTFGRPLRTTTAHTYLPRHQGGVWRVRRLGPMEGRARRRARRTCHMREQPHARVRVGSRGV
jgi:hypothetical protein